MSDNTELTGWDKEIADMKAELSRELTRAEKATIDKAFNLSCNPAIPAELCMFPTSPMDWIMTAAKLAVFRLRQKHYELIHCDPEIYIPLALNLSFQRDCYSGPLALSEAIYRRLKKLMKQDNDLFGAIGLGFLTMMEYDNGFEKSGYALLLAHVKESAIQGNADND